MQKRIVTILVAALFTLGTGMVAAQSRGGGGGGMHGGMGGGGGGMHGGMGGGGWSGGGRGGGGWHGGGSWNGGGGGWHGGNWNGGWHGGNWNGWHGGSNWRGSVFVGIPGGWWWPGYYPYWGWGGYNYASYPYPYYADAATYADPGQVVYIQRDQVADGNYAPAPPPAARSGPPGQSSYQFSYYCIDPAGYYPQIQQCARGWLKVVPDGAARPTPIPQYSQ